MAAARKKRPFHRRGRPEVNGGVKEKPLEEGKEAQAMRRERKRAKTLFRKRGLMTSSQGKE